MREQNGGPAFPVLKRLSNTTRQRGEPDYTAETAGGMSLRDYFAGQTIAAAAQMGMAAPENVARYAYEVADAMLAARERTESEGPR